MWRRVLVEQSCITKAHSLIKGTVCQEMAGVSGRENKGAGKRQVRLVFYEPTVLASKLTWFYEENRTRESWGLNRLTHC